MFSNSDPGLPFGQDTNNSHTQLSDGCSDEQFQHLRRKYAIGCIISHTSYIAKQITK